MTTCRCAGDGQPARSVKRTLVLIGHKYPFGFHSFRDMDSLVIGRGNRSDTPARGEMFICSNAPGLIQLAGHVIAAHLSQPWTAPARGSSRRKHTVRARSCRFVLCGSPRSGRNALPWLLRLVSAAYEISSHR